MLSAAVTTRVHVTLTPHTPLTHAGVGAVHTLPHAPQLVPLVRLLISQPSEGVPLQSRNPAMHVNPQVPPVHSAVAFGRAGHDRPHALQLAGSALRLTQVPLQLVCPAPHETITQLPPEHVRPAAHTMPHAPQLTLSVIEFTHTPLQFSCPGAHVGDAHIPPAHARPAAHALPHAPQLALSVNGFTHTPPQFICPGAHVVAHMPPVHSWPAAHAVPHVPQFALSVVEFTHRPLHAI